MYSQQEIKSTAVKLRNTIDFRMHPSFRNVKKMDVLKLMKNGSILLARLAPSVFRIENDLHYFQLIFKKKSLPLYYVTISLIPTSPCITASYKGPKR